MNLELIPLLAAGLAAGLAMLAVQAVASAVRPREVFDPLGLWSSLLALPERSAPITGFLVHLLVSVGVAAGYALGFRLAAVTDMGWAWGLVGGIIHWVAAGAFVAIVPGPGDSSSRSSGAFARALGPAGTIGFLAAHLVFGLVVALVYFTLHSSGGVQAAL
jgi:hypothetical protein